MRSIRAVFGIVVIAALALAAPASAQEQEITASHLQAALDAITASHTSDNFDTVLPDVAQQVSASLIQSRPDSYAAIESAVQDAAVALVTRRADLNNDIARIWAQEFTEDELNTISTFYRTSAGQKLALEGNQLLQDTLQAVQAWSNRLGEEMLDQAKTALEAQGIVFAATAPATPAPATGGN